MAANTGETVKRSLKTFLYYFQQGATTLHVMQKCRRFVCHLFYSVDKGRSRRSGRRGTGAALKATWNPFLIFYAQRPLWAVAFEQFIAVPHKATRQLGVACHGMKPAVLAAVHPPSSSFSFPCPSLSTQFDCQKHVKGVVVIVIGLQLWGKNLRQSNQTHSPEIIDV